MSSVIAKLKKGLENPRLFGQFFLGLRASRLLTDKVHISWHYYLRLGKRINLKNPISFNEKLQWLKLHDRNPEYTKWVDKYAIRKHIRETIGEKYLVPLLGVYDRVEDIDYSVLPKEFVLKPTHTSGNVLICRDKSKLNISETKKLLNRWMKREYFWYQREWPYKNIKPRIICEELLVDESGYELKDYKFYCFNGKPKLIQVMSNRNGGNYNINHYDTDWNEIEIKRESLFPAPNGIRKPNMLAEMLEITALLSKKIPFVRVDLYFTGEKIYFGELTFYPASGFIDFVDDSDDYLLGSWIDLLLVKQNTQMREGI